MRRREFLCGGRLGLVATAVLGAARLRHWGALAALAFAASALAAPTRFADRSLEIPAPQGFLPMSADAPKYVEIAQGFLPPNNRLVESYVGSADHDALLGGKATDLARQFQLQVPRNLEGRLVSQQEFVEVSAQMDAEMRKAFANIDEQAGKLSAAGNAKVKQRTGLDAGVALSDIGYHGVYRREDWGMFFTLSTRVAAHVGAERSSDQVAGGGALVLIDHQLLYLYAYANQRGGDDMAWVKRSLSAWADAVHAANPDDPRREAQARRERGGFDAGRLGYFAGLGAFVGLMAYFLRKRA